jgi:hypothetical protein
MRRDIENEYFTDDRSGSDQVTDSDEEFERIVKVDQTISQITNGENKVDAE